MDRNQILTYLRGLDDEQWQQFVAEARGTAEQSGDWRQSMAKKNRKLAQLISNADENGHQR